MGHHRERSLGQRRHTAAGALFGLVAVAAVGCAAMNSNLGLGGAEQTKTLQPGMTYDQVYQRLGDPRGSRTEGNRWIVTWSLHEYGKGWVPYEMVFDADQKTLISWAANAPASTQPQPRAIATGAASPPAAASEGPLSVPAPAPQPPRQPPAPEAATVPPAQRKLMRQMSGIYYSFSSAGPGFSGGTERTVYLCTNGRYYMKRESSYSGGAGTADAWGTAAQGGGTGTWRIQGNVDQGTLVTTDTSGQATTYPYRRCGNDCVYFGNNKFAYAGPTACH